MKKAYPFIWIAGVFGISGVSYAGLFPTTTVIDVPCSSPSGVWITDNTLAAECCDSQGNPLPNAPEKCKLGLGNDQTQILNSAANYSNFARTVTQQAVGFTGQNVDFSNTPGAHDLGLSTSPVTAPNGTLGGDPTGADPNSTSGGLMNPPSGMGAGPGNSGAGGSGSGGGAMGGRAASSGKGDSTSGAGAGVHDASGPASGAGYIGAFKEMVVQMLDTKVLNNAPSELNYPGAEKPRLNVSRNEDGDEMGTSFDPPDYLNRIDRSTSLFKVISNRYSRKKSLTVP